MPEQARSSRTPPVTHWRHLVRVNPSWEARIGFAYDNSPIEAGIPQPEHFPDSDRIWYSAGATYHIDRT